ncbi:division cycle 123 protein [Moumouvirus goulette]|uniref:Division cycle 123 protein n=1 Tax=Moumouvirus goulette TaxID=1247379 RepID=M1PCK0_9VIRU|nr:division cycle 123 protein [Moumouvirus goulette]AGF85714.1 division cycle 123 protein [Moumouvirus goulette]
MIHIEYIKEITNLDDFNSNNHPKFPNDKEANGLDYKTELWKTNLSNYYDLINYTVSWTYDFNLSETKILLKACQIGSISGKCPKIYDDELGEIINKLNSSWKSGSWFMRLDASSTKDSIINPPFKSAQSVITSIVTSRRTINALTDNINRNLNTRIYFTPYDSKWNSSRELRCFIRNNKLIAISQYCWTRCEFFCDFSKDELISLADRINKLVNNIIEDLSNRIDTKDMVMDIYLDDNDNLQIIELNSFGYWLASGSALFHWIKDYDKLYNTNGDIYFRILDN